ncbi:bifunctional adenosylcobinamide kinase/adenosylcobinamide-phosphate guanylyltransferase [Methylobrevis pamukkalensis]|uniref:Bifunctional adenosylcobalamin biosynthesis protein n=1 Tax=Methylobrevis pamukkalensis TaxID=1439726 RepID=A0A1E3H026_9HYPH|nr:bifunctional adenosylcobinamide kinase/adenosylcobinamide-phosphate guanylyltransferase [Methylobrevis pamukkalensis]ODN69634.1 Bifunctional adenosylcobalamin biosynthesis protein CobP [Methylobrevis pamukkalensis]
MGEAEDATGSAGPSVRPRVTLVLGGARSGKTAHAERLVLAMAHGEDGAAPAGGAVYIATAQALDAEMAERIGRHQADRAGRFATLEAPIDLAGALRGARGAVLVDCLTLWLSNLMMHDADIPAAVDALLAALADVPGPVVLVSNEIGFGIVPDNALARRFRDEAGRLHQKIAALADRVDLVVASLRVPVKG